MSIKITPKMFAALDSKVQAAISSLVQVKPKRTVSPEQLAAMKAGREAAKLKKTLKTEELVEQKKRGPKPLASKTPEELAAHKTRVAERKAERKAKKLVEPVLPEAVPAPEPVAEAKPTEAKPKRALSAEHLAKLKAGREAAKAKKLAAAPEPLPVAEPKPKRTLSPEHLAKLKAGREAAKAKKPVSPEAPRPTIDIPLDSVVPDEPVVVEPVVSIIPEELAADKAPKVTFKEPVTEVQPTEVQPTEVQPTVAGPKKRGPKPLASKTPEELLAHKLKLEERRAIRKGTTELLPLPLFKLKSA